MIVTLAALLISTALAIEPPKELLLDYQKMGVTREEFVCLAQNAYFEARSDTPEAQVAITHVVLNRGKRERFPHYCRIIRSLGRVRGTCGFSWYCDDKEDTPKEARAWLRACAIVALVLEYKVADPTHGALYYHEVSIRKPYWSLLMRSPLRIGKHLFY